MFPSLIGGLCAGLIVGANMVSEDSLKEASAVQSSCQSPYGSSPEIEEADPIAQILVGLDLHDVETSLTVFAAQPRPM